MPNVPTPPRRATGRRALLLTAIAGTALATPAGAVERMCGPDPVASTADVLCAPPSGPCDAATVTVSASIELPGGCRFDLGGRALVVTRTITIPGRSDLIISNAGDVHITDTGRLKARGDFRPPSSFVESGGSIRILAAGTLTIDGLLDVTGDPGGLIDVVAGQHIVLGAAGQIRGNGISSFLDEGERFADGGAALLSATGSIRIAGPVDLIGQSAGAGGVLEMFAGRDITLTQRIDLTGGGGDGGELLADAGDHITITRSVDLDSASGGGSGGTLVLAAGEDGPGDAVPGGTIVIEHAIITMRGSVFEEFSGDGGELDLASQGDITLTDVVVRADAPPGLDGGGGQVFIDSRSSGDAAIAPLDGHVRLDGLFSLRSGPVFGFGGDFEVSAGRDLAQHGEIDLGNDGGGALDLIAKGSIFLRGPMTLSLPQSEDGSSAYIEAGAGAEGTLVLGADLLARSGVEGGSDVTLTACTLRVEDGVTIDLRGGGHPVLRLVSREPMQLGAGSRYLTGANGEIALGQLPGIDPLIGAGVVFEPLPGIDTSGRDVPLCVPATCGNGVVEGPEQCDDGNADDDDGCSAVCAARCTAAPLAACTTPVASDRAALALRDDTRDERDHLSWRWTHGDATTRADFGDPTESTHYALCLYDAAAGADGLAFQAIAPAGGSCDGRPCWKETARGFTYDDPARTPDGIDSLTLEPGAAGAAKVIATARGASLALPDLPLPVPLRAQLQGSHGRCWEATYSAAARNDGTRFEAVGD